MCFHSKKKKKGNQNPETSKAVPEIDPERKRKQSIRCSTPRGNSYNLEKKTRGTQCPPTSHRRTSEHKPSCLKIILPRTLRRGS